MTQTERTWQLYSEAMALQARTAALARELSATARHSPLRSESQHEVVYICSQLLSDAVNRLSEPAQRLSEVAERLGAL